MNLNILFCGDENIADGVFMSALTLSKNSSDALRIYILTAGASSPEKVYKPLSKSFAERLEKRISEGNKDNRVFLFDISREFCGYIPAANMETRFTPLCMLRLFADRVPEISGRFLYLDADVLCRGGFSELKDFDMGNAEIAGVPDRYGKWFFGNIFRHDYLNSGVLLMDMDNIRKSGLFEKCRRLCAEEKMFMPDQTALNKLAVKLKLPKKYNEQGKIGKDTVFKHFTTYFEFLPFFHAVTVKPWDADKMHDKLGVYEFDDIIKELQKEKLR